MSHDNVAFFIVSGPVKDAVAAYFAAKDAHLDYMRVIADEIGMKNLHAHDNGSSAVIGFSGGEAPTYMKSIDSRPSLRHIMVPQKRDPAGKALRAKMNAAPQMSSLDTILQAAGLDTGFYISEGMGHIHTCGLATFGDTVILMLRTDNEGKTLAGEPRHCERIPTSRYYLLKEESEVTKKE